MSSAPRVPKNARREAARERAREERDQQRRRERRRRITLQASVAVVVVAIVAVVAVVIVNVNRPAGPGPRNMAQGGLTVTGADLAAVTTPGAAPDATPEPQPVPTGTTLVQIFEDFGCPYCNQFESANSSHLESLVRSGDIQVQYLPVAILDRSFTDRYSTRAANAAAAVANWSPDTYVDFHTRLYAEQPDEGGAGLSDDRMIAIAKAVGVKHLDLVSAAIRDGRFEKWVTARTQEFTTKTGALADATIAAANVASTPTVLVDGDYYTGAPGDAAAFDAFLAERTAASAPATPSAG